MSLYRVSPLALRTPTELSSDILLVAAGPPATNDETPPHWPLTLHADPTLGTPASPPDIHNATLPIWRHADGLLIGHPPRHLLLETQGHTVRIHPDALHPEQHTRGLAPTLRLALATAASLKGALALHAAYVLHPKLGRVLIAGGSGAGKTTTTATLLLTGAAFATDDIVFALPQHLHADSPLRAWPTFLHLNPFTANLMRRHGADIPPGTERIAWDARTAFPAAPRALEAPDLIVLPHVEPDRPGRAVPLSRAQALAQLLYAAPVLPLLEPHARAEQRQRAASLVQHARAVHLKLGDDLAEHPERVVDRLLHPQP